MCFIALLAPLYNYKYTSLSKIKQNDQIYAVLKIEVNCDFGPLKAKTFFTEDNFMY